VDHGRAHKEPKSNAQGAGKVWQVLVGDGTSTVLVLLDDGVDERRHHVPELAAADGTHGRVGHVRRVADTISLRFTAYCCCSPGEAARSVVASGPPPRARPYEPTRRSLSSFVV